MGSNRRYPDLARGYRVEIIRAAGPPLVVADLEPDRVKAEQLYRTTVVAHPHALVLLRDGALIVARSRGDPS